MSCLAFEFGPELQATSKFQVSSFLLEGLLPPSTAQLAPSASPSRHPASPSRHPTTPPRHPASPPRLATTQRRPPPPPPNLVPPRLTSPRSVFFPFIHFGFDLALTASARKDDYLLLCSIILFSHCTYRLLGVTRWPVFGWPNTHVPQSVFILLYFIFILRLASLGLFLFMYITISTSIVPKH